MIKEPEELKIDGEECWSCGGRMEEVGWSCDNRGYEVLHKCGCGKWYKETAKYSHRGGIEFEEILPGDPDREELERLRD